MIEFINCNRVSRKPLTGTAVEARQCPTSACSGRFRPLNDSKWPVSASLRRPTAQPSELYLVLLGHFQRLVYLNAEVPDRALQPMS
jgi:hypothetical protein